MADQGRRPHAWERFTCGGCSKTVQRRRRGISNPGKQRCLCCSFLDTVHDVRMREALRTVFEPEGGLIAEPRPNRRFGNQADAPGDAGRPLP